jgi:hypothetical protein
MLASRHGVLGQTTKTAWVCLSCRTKQQQQRRGEHTSTGTKAIAYDGQDAFKQITHGQYGSQLEDKRKAARRQNQEQYGTVQTFAWYVEAHTGKAPKELPLLVRKWYRHGFMNKPAGDTSSPGTRSLDRFISTRTDKTVHQLTGQELETFIKEHRELQKRRRASMRQCSIGHGGCQVSRSKALDQNSTLIYSRKHQRSHIEEQWYLEAQWIVS